MLPAQSRVHRPREFRAVVRRGVRAGRQTLVVHASRAADETLVGDPEPKLFTGSVDNSLESASIPTADSAAPRVGFIVSKAVGNAVTRNRVKRRLRHLSRGLLEATPPHTLIVVRALPSASSHPDALADELDAAWTQALRRLGSVERPPTRPAPPRGGR